MMQLCATIQVLKNSQGELNELRDDLSKLENNLKEHMR